MGKKFTCNRDELYILLLDDDKLVYGELDWLRYFPVMVIHRWGKMEVVSGIVPAVWRSPDEVSPEPVDIRRFCFGFFYPGFFKKKDKEETDKVTKGPFSSVD